MAGPGHIWIAGDALIDFVPVDTAPGGAFLPRAGGGSFNVARAAVRQGAAVSFIGPLSTDMFGQRLTLELEAEGVDLQYAARIDAPTPLAFVDYVEAEARFAFFERGSTLVEAPYDLEDAVIAEGDVLHLGSIALIPDPGASRLEHMVRRHRGTAIITLDPNARLSITPNVGQWRRRMDDLAGHASILRLSVEDLEAWRPGTTPDDFITARLAAGDSMVVLTFGDGGVMAATQSARVQAPAMSDGVVDTVGAGDVVMGTILASLQASGLATPDAIAAQGETALGTLMARAMAAAWLNCQCKGCDPPDCASIDGALGRVGTGQEKGRSA